LGRQFWRGLQVWGRHMMKRSVFEKKELGFGRVTDSPREAVELIRRSVAPGLRKLLQAQA
jgi:hypothetical protein